MNYFAEMQEQYEDIVRMVCNQNDVIYTMSYNPHFPSMQHATCYEFEVKKGWTGMSDYPRPIIIDWDGFKGTLYDLLYILKCYFKDEHLTKYNYDWSFIMNYFTKKDLKNGDVVKLRDGQVGIVLITGNELNKIIFPETSYFLSDYKDDLTRPTKNHELCSADIMAVRRPENANVNFFKVFKCNNGRLVYERKEVEEMKAILEGDEDALAHYGVKRRSGRYPWGSGEEMTLEEVCKALGKEIKIVKSKGE